MTCDDLQAMLDRFCAGYSDPLMRNYLNFLTFAVDEMKPRHIVEIGTGAGTAARMMMPMVPRESRLTTVYMPDQSYEELLPWIGTKRLSMVPWLSHAGQGDCDMLCLHRCDPAEALDLYDDVPADGCVAFVAEIAGREEWFAGLPYEKLHADLCGGKFGMFIYRRGG